MSKPSPTSASRIYTNKNYPTLLYDEANNDDRYLSQYNIRASNNNTKTNVPFSQVPRQMSATSISQSRPLSTANLHQTTNVQKKPPRSGARRRNRNQTKKTDVSQDKNQKNTSAVCRKEFTREHVEALKIAFNKVLNNEFLTSNDHEQHLEIYHQIRDLILNKRPDARITLYGSSLFGCCLKVTSNIDLDIQLNETLPYETLKELLSIIRHCDFCREAHMNTNHEVMFVDTSIRNSNTVVRITTNNTRAIYISKIIEIYTKFDNRVLPLLHLFRFLANTCDVDKPTRGTLHPIVFNFMLIHFLQQLDPPVLPCLHEYVFGIDYVPVVLTDDQYVDFFRICNTYVSNWKSKNTTSIEILLLQLLSYYVKKFNAQRFIVSIQTRMPFLKNERQIFNRKLLCADPTTINRSLSYTMKATCSYKYFCRTLKEILNYFCQVKNDDTTSTNPLVDTVHRSYNLLIERFPKNTNNNTKLRQEDIRQYYRQTFDESVNPLPEPILRLNEMNILQSLPDVDDDEIEDKPDTAIEQTNTNAQTSMLQNEFQSLYEEDDLYSNEKEEPTPIETGNGYSSKGASHAQQDRRYNSTKDKIPSDTKFSAKSSPNYESSNKFDSYQLENLVISSPSTERGLSFDGSEHTTNPNVTFFFDMQPKNFGADKGAPTVCTACYKNTHMRADCPELVLPKINNLPRMTNEWLNTISRVSRQVADEYKTTRKDVQIRKEIVHYLQSEFKQCYPSCCVYAYGSSENGFGLRQSDLDICVELQDITKELNIIVLEKLFQIINSKSRMFKNVELVRDARIPIIRLIHAQYDIEIDISLNNLVAMENTRLLKTYTKIDLRVAELGYMMKCLAKTCDIGDASRGTLSSYAYIIMIIHFLQQIDPPVLPVLQQLNDDPLKKNEMYRKCDQWNVYFYDNLSNLKQVWTNKNQSNTLSTGELWMAFLHYYTERFDYTNNIVTIRQLEPLKRDEKGWFNPTIAIEDPFVLTHNLADKLSLQKWILIRRVFIRAREQFGLSWDDNDIRQTKLSWISDYLFDIYTLCPENTEEFYFASHSNGSSKKPRTKKAAVSKDNHQTSNDLTNH